ncbi:hypothetical protein BH23GEM7_BH23GEM7_11790 [soil metagenome]|nr:FHA domain-containing protein [Gemmatimonadota bacterium]
MDADLHVLSGAAAGRNLTLAAESILIGRHPDADLRFDADNELEVSARHATLTRHGDLWVLRDLESRNGTFLNGRPVEAATVLRAGDRIAFGRYGPEVEFRAAGGGTPAAGTAAAGSAATPSRAAAPALPPAVQREESPTLRIQVAVARETRGLRMVAVALALLLAAAVGTFLYAGGRQQAAWERERSGLNERLDSILISSEQTIRALEGQLGGLAEALRESQEQVQQARGRLERATDRGESARLPTLRRELETATTTLERQQTAATLDFRTIERENRRAIARIYAESESGEISTATAFAVRADATLLTSRHVVVGEDGRRARRIAIQFSGSEQVWPARILRISAEADLAVIKVDNILGGVPTVRTLNLRPDTVRLGAAVAVLGYPHETQTEPPAGSQRVRLAQPLLAAGSLGSVTAWMLEVQGYGAPGGSGSPIFDANGEVLAVLFGGWHEEGRQTLVAVPASVAAQLLEETR